MSSTSTGTTISISISDLLQTPRSETESHGRALEPQRHERQAVNFNTVPHLPVDERSDTMEVEIAPSLPPDTSEIQSYERPDISQLIRLQFVDVGRALGESSGVKRRKRTSPVWQHFEPLKDANGKVRRAKCNYCGNVYDADSRSGTSRLSNHLKSKSCLRHRNEGAGGDKLAGNLSDTIAIKEKSVMDQPLNHLDVARMIIKQDDTSRIDSTNQHYIIELYKDEKKKLCNYFTKCSRRLCLTVCFNDICSSFYFYLMVWFIDDDWKLKNKILKRFSPRGPIEIKDIKDVLLDWGIVNNLSFMVIDGDFDCNMYKGDDWFSNQGSLFFNNMFLCNKGFMSGFQYDSDCLQDYLFDNLEILVNNISERSPQNEKFRNAPTKEDLYKKLVWSYEYSNCLGVLKNVWSLKEALSDLENVDPHFQNLTKEAWDVVRVTCECYKDWGSIECCSNNSTANTYFPLLCSIYKYFKELRKCHVDIFNDELIEGTWCKYNLVLAVASVLDPRFKMDIVKNWYEKIFGDEWTKEFTNFNTSFTDIYSGYEGGTNSSISYKMVDSLGQPCNSSYEPNHAQRELDRYLEEGKFPPFKDFDILEWWQVNARLFPTLARMARDFLPIQSESSPYVANDEITFEKLEKEMFSNFHMKEDDEITIEGYGKLCASIDDIEEAYICTKSWLAT